MEKSSQKQLVSKQEEITVDYFKSVIPGMEKLKETKIVKPELVGKICGSYKVHLIWV